MELLSAEGHRFVFRLGKREKQLLCQALKLYPLIPRSHHQLSRQAGAADAEDQALLEEAIATQKQSHKQQVDALLANKARFVEEPGGFRFELDRDQIEWLLQVLNDVRVGSWLILGCPDPDERKEPKLTPENAAFYLAMELCGEFECDLLEALDRAH
jgi:hypothetical protein